MSTTTEETTDLGVEMVITLHVGEGGLDRYLELIDDRAGPRIRYLEGMLTLVSPTRKHDRGADRLDGVIKAIGAELDIPYQANASTLFRRKKKDAGIEADRSYYIANEPAVRDVEGEIDLEIHPPPDLMVEVVVTHGPQEALAVCRALGVPEVWVYRPRKRALEFLHLDDRGEYVARETSRSFPFLNPADVLSWVESTEAEPDNRWERRLRAWARDELARRVRGGG